MPTFLDSLPEVFVSSTEISSQVSQAVADGKLKKLASRLYTKNMLDAPEVIVQRRDKAGLIAKELDMTVEFQKLDDLIGTLQGTRTAELKSDVAKARKGEEPYDPDRAELFLKLYEDLKATAPSSRSAKKLSQQERINLSFFEAYFSNFIEGTEFEVGEAADIVFRSAIPTERPEDAHDVLGTY